MNSTARGALPDSTFTEKEAEDGTGVGAGIGVAVGVAAGVAIRAVPMAVGVGPLVAADILAVAKVAVVGADPCPSQAIATIENSATRETTTSQLS